MRKIFAFILALVALISDPAFAGMNFPPVPATLPGSSCGSDYANAATVSTSSASLVMAGFGLTGWSCTPTTSKVFVLAYGVSQETLANNTEWQIRCGTGTAPSAAAAVTGTLVGRSEVTNTGASTDFPISANGFFTVTPGTAIWCDIAYSVSTSGTLSVTRAAVSILNSN